MTRRRLLEAVRRLARRPPTIWAVAESGALVVLASTWGLGWTRYAWMTMLVLDAWVLGRWTDHNGGQATPPEPAPRRRSLAARIRRLPASTPEQADAILNVAAAVGACEALLHLYTTDATIIQVTAALDQEHPQ